MTTLREAAEMALEALEDSCYPRASTKHSTRYDDAIDVLRKALDADSMASLPEPVAWMDREGDIYRMPEIKNWAPPHTLLYTIQPQREWQGLTDYEINNFDLPESGTVTIREFVRIIEAKLKEKNT